MIRSAISLAAALALPLAAPVESKPVAEKSAADWTRTVSLTSEGGFRMGNPAAPVKLVEYGSLACPHCREFEQTGFKPLVQRYVRTGKVSYEYRNLLINGPDISISLLTRCAGAAKFFPMASYVYATQPQWEEKLASVSDAQKAELEKLSNQQLIVRFAEIGGFVPIAAKFGVTPARARQCLADPKGLQRLLDMTKSAQASGISGTPSFIINGKPVQAVTWEQLEPHLRAALGGRG